MLRLDMANGDITAYRNIYAQAFYDYSDNNYFVDPNGQSRISRMNISAAQVQATNKAGGRLRISSYTTGKGEISADTNNLVLGPSATRSGTGYYAGIAINGLLNYNGVTSYDVSPHIWIGGQYRDTPGSERSDFVIAVKSGTGTTGTKMTRSFLIQTMCHFS
jgi:hypothetical protein